MALFLLRRGSFLGHQPDATADQQQRECDEVMNHTRFECSGVAPGAQIYLQLRLAGAAKLQEPPELQLRADKNTRYEAVAQVMAAAQAKGLTRLGFVTDPKKENAHGQR